jgi:hypothetical protein
MRLQVVRVYSLAVMLSPGRVLTSTQNWGTTQVVAARLPKLAVKRRGRGSSAFCLRHQSLNNSLGGPGGFFSVMKCGRIFFGPKTLIVWKNPKGPAALLAGNYLKPLARGARFFLHCGKLILANDRGEAKD